MQTKLLSNQTALVTGASSGLGVDFARELAARGANLVLVARRAEQLNAVASELTARYGVQVRSLPLDLAAPGATQSLYDTLQAEGIHIDILVNNAGFGLYGHFSEIPWEKEKAMLDLDIIVLTHLTKLFLKDMLTANHGYILQVASIGAYQPSPTYASYSAAKAYVLSLGEAINYELRGTGVSVTVVSPGVTQTEFLKVSGQSPSLYQRLVMMKSPDVARIAIQSMLRRRASVVPGLVNALSAFMVRFMPRRLQAASAYALMTRS